MNSPLVTVLMAVRDGERYLPQALASIRAQSFADYELVVVEDDSHDATLEILVAAAAEDARLRVVRNGGHRGLTRSLNRGLELARGRYIARLDADDWMLPRRLAVQFQRMEAEPALVLLGSEVGYMDEAGSPLVKRDPAPPLTDVGIRWMLMFDNAFYHSAVMFRRVLPGWPQGVRYDEAFRYGQDRALWPRLLEVGRGANSAEVLTWCRLHGGRLSTPEVRQVRLRQCLEGAVEYAARYRPEEVWTPEGLMALKRAWHGFPAGGATGVDLVPYVQLLQLFLAFARRHEGAELEEQRRYLMDHLFSLLVSHGGAAWESGLIGGLLRQVPGGVLQAAARKMKLLR